MYDFQRCSWIFMISFVILTDVVRLDGFGWIWMDSDEYGFIWIDITGESVVDTCENAVSKKLRDHCARMQYQQKSCAINVQDCSISRISQQPRSHQSHRSHQIHRINRKQPSHRSHRNHGRQRSHRQHQSLLSHLRYRSHRSCRNR